MRARLDDGAVRLLLDTLRTHEQELLHSLNEFSLDLGYSMYTSTLEEAWRQSIRGLTDSLEDLLASRAFDLEITADEDVSTDPAVQFGVTEAHKHRGRGIGLAMFLSLMKYYRESYLGVVAKHIDPESRLDTERAVNRFFDRVEIGLSAEWAGLEEDERIAELSAMNRTLTNEKNRYLTIFESLNAPVLLLDEQGMLVNYNAAAASAFSLGDEGESPYYSGVGTGVAFQPLSSHMEEFVKSTAEEMSIEATLDTSTGPRDYSVRFKRMLDVSEKFTGITVLFSDETEERASKLEAQENWRLYQLLFRSMPAAFAHHRLVRDAAGEPIDYVFLEVNEGFESMTGVRASHTLGKRMTEVLPSIADDEVDWVRTYARVVDEQRSMNLVAWSTGLRRWFDISVYPTQEECFAVVFLDVTERHEYARQLEETVNRRTADLEEAAQRLRNAVKIKDEFLASMSHELRTPLNSILGFSGLMLQGAAGELTEEQGKQMSMIKASGERLLVLVNQVLDLAKIEAGKTETEIVTFDLENLIRGVAALCEPLIAQRDLTIEIECEEACRTVRSDSDKVSQILLNLVSNAVKFTSQGQISMVASREGGHVRIGVSDTGNGIPVEEIPFLFAEFRRLGRPHSEIGGSGLGLSISQRLAGVLGGSIEVETEVGAGSTFTLILPMSIPEG